MGLLSKSSSVDTVIYTIINPLVRRVNFGAQAGRIEVTAIFLVRQQLIEGAVHHSNNVCTFIVHNLARLGVIESRRGKSALILWVDFIEYVLQVSECGMVRIWGHMNGKILL